MADPEITHIEGSKYRYLDKVNNEDFKFEVHKGHSLSAARESVAAQIIRNKLNLRPSDYITTIDDTDGKNSH